MGDGEKLSPRSTGTRRGATIVQVAEAAGVSRATVSLVLRQSPLVADETRERVQQSISAVGYVYNRGAAQLRSGVSGTIGVIVPEITNPFYAELLSGIDDTLDVDGRLCFVANSADSPERQERFIRRIRERGVEGIIICAAEGSSPLLLGRMRDWNLPFVQILRSFGGDASDFVAPDFAMGTRMAVEYLVSKGHDRIALLPSAKNTSAARERIAAFTSAVRQCGLGAGLVLPGRSSRFDAGEVVAEVLSRSNPPSAIICHNDLLALGVVVALRQLGIVPGVDLSVVGFDNIPESSHSVPALTTVATLPVEVGARAASLLLRRIMRPAGPAERILISPHLVVRDT
ncbi:MAG TPA: LacI family DNA-binding transcriptional regulator [Acidisoma sp.]|uniref:LacI family DNA-binding transcriptional regulator n=1 Tax=Acidisoma sp. TaxID=1872115 RepID=UPI002C81405C|nr:LacI family DNA-binding transcriptional regulator [Acidisoma sp.]HTH99612.1 LacI family DNA-binding transcriptional regulator [Acidisoma sp.]